MGALEWIKRNSRAVSDATAGSGAYYELATTNLSLMRALGTVFRRHARGRLLDAGAGRQAYRPLLEPLAESYEALDVVGATCVPDHAGDVQSMPLPGASFDTVVCTQVLQHVPEPLQALNEIARVLRPGGKVVLSVPHLVWLHNEPHDYWRFTGHGLRHMLGRAGLETLSCEAVGGLVCFLAYAPSNALLSACWPVRPLFWAAFQANRLAVRVALGVDRLVGLPQLYPANFVAVARKA